MKATEQYFPMELFIRLNLKFSMTLSHLELKGLRGRIQGSILTFAIVVSMDLTSPMSC